MMADIRNDIIELQEKVLGGRRGLSLETPSHSSGELEFVEWGSGQGDIMLNTWRSEMIFFSDQGSSSNQPVCEGERCFRDEQA